MRRFGFILAIAAALASGASALSSAEEVKVPAGMVFVPGGAFRMGRDTGEGEKPANDSPQHLANVKPYYISRYEVSNGEFSKFIQAKGYEKEEYWSKEGFSWLQKAGRKLPKDWERIRKELGDEFSSHPVVGVSWYEADAYARFAGARLPTEAEWERAARGTDGRKFPWGNKFETGLRDKPDDEGGRTYPVGKSPADVSPTGAFDMGGNVSEWTSSWFEGYPGTKYKSRYWGKDAKRKLRVARGGSWRFIDGGPRPVENKCRVTYRLFEYPHDTGYVFTGFRLAMDVPEKKKDEKKKDEKKD